MRRPFGDLQPEPVGDCIAGSDEALITGICKETLQPGEPPFDPTAGQGQTITVLDIGGMHRKVQRQAERAGDEMALSAVDLLSRVVATQTAGFRGFDTLAIDHTRGG